MERICEGVAINLSLFLITKAYSFVSEIKRTEASLQRNLEEYLSEAINETVLGQQADLESSSRGWSLERYQEISGAKVERFWPPFCVSDVPPGRNSNYSRAL